MPATYQLDILRELREAAGLTQEEMARLCGLGGQKSRQTAGAWERGDIIPTRTRRTRFIGYLWDHLRLRHDPARFELVWEVLMREWGWEPISDKEWASFTGQDRPRRGGAGATHDPAHDLAHEQAFEQRLALLVATVDRMQSSVNNAPSSPSVRPTNVQGTLALPLTTLPDPAPLPPGSRMPLGKNPLFVGRRAELLALAAAFARGDTTAIGAESTLTSSIAATGLGGIGKTQLASEFVHRYGQFFTSGVFWLKFENGNALAGEVAACGGAGAMALRPDFATLPLDDQVRLVQAAWQEAVPRLLVFDNCEEPALLTQWRPVTGGCRVLITSRRGDWEPTLNVQQVALAVFSRQESMYLLRVHCPHGDDAMLDAIAAELGDLPLALHLAGSYLYRYRRAITPQQYLVFLRDPNLLHHPSLQGSGISPTAHVQHVGRTFALSYERLRPEEPRDELALRLLLHMASFAPGEAVTYALVAETLAKNLADPQEAVALEEAVIRLVELGLIVVHEDKVHEDKQLWMHRLVARFVCGADPKAWQQTQPQIEAIVLQKLDEYYVDGKPLPLLPIQNHIRHVVETALQREDAAGATLGTAFARYLRGIGDLASGLRYAEEALDIRLRVWGDHHADTATSHHLIGMLRQGNGDFAQAHFHYQKSLDICLLLYGEYHFTTADILSTLGDLLWVEQRNQEAIATLERALNICDEAVEEDHPLVAEITLELGLCMLDGGFNLAAARHYMEEAVRIRRAKLGEDHPHTAIAYMNTGYFFHQTGELESAGSYYQHALEIHMRILGEGHVATANSIYCLGRLRRMQEQWDEAAQLLERAFAIFQDDGHDIVSIAACLNELGAVALGRGDLPHARLCVEQALAIRQKLFQDTHPHVANTLQNLGQVLLVQGEIAAAERVLLQALHARQQTPDPENLRVAETLLTLAHVAEKGESPQQAHAYYAQCYAIHLRHLGADHATTRALAQTLETLQSQLRL